MYTEMKFEHKSFGNRLKSMMKVDFRRMFTSKLFYIMIGVCLIVPILILVMTTMMDGTVALTRKPVRKRLWRDLTTHGRSSGRSAASNPQE